MAAHGINLVDPERALAVAYAPASVRPALTALFALDERLGAIVAGTTEPTIGLIRLAWWREALERLDAVSPPAEPLLRAVAGDVLPRGLSGTALSQIEPGWAALLDGEDDADTVARFARSRGGTLFALAAHLLGSDDPRLPHAGEVWSLVDLVHRHSSPAIRLQALERARTTLAHIPRGQWKTAARPLAALLALARRDLASDGPRVQGAPWRVARMLAMRLFGR